MGTMPASTATGLTVTAPPRGCAKREKPLWNRRNGRALEGRDPGETSTMKRLAALLALTGAFSVAACDDPRQDDFENDDMAVEAPVAHTAEDTALPAEATAPTTPPPPTDSTTLPSEKRSSEESVQPE